MALGPRLDLRQSQQLVMTPQLQQAIKLLTLTNLELESFVLAELEKNPLLEQASDDYGGDAEPGEPEPRDVSDDFDPELPAEPATADRLIEVGDGLSDAPLDADYAQETFQHDSASDSPADAGGMLGMNGAGAVQTATEGAGDIDLIAMEGGSLVDRLFEQANATLEGVELMIARHLIGHIDDAGYFTGDIDEIAEALSVARQEVEAALAVIQTFEPTGVGARTLAECLSLQAREAGKLDAPMAKLLKNLDLLARGDVTALKRLCGVGPEALTSLVRELRAFNPKPGLLFGGEPTRAVVPDIFVVRGKQGWTIELNSATLPRVLVNRSYVAEVSRDARGGAKSFLSDCLTSANWLMKALDQRARTIIKVSTEIVRQQEGFFEGGVRYLKPLNLRTIADAVGMHESTISRVTSHKYLSCERGLFELRYFFTPALATAGAGDELVSTESVKKRVRDLIEEETPSNVLSDDKLVELLRREGFDVARRTVAKYREAMNIGSSVQRRRQLQLSA